MSKSPDSDEHERALKAFERMEYSIGPPLNALREEEKNIRANSARQWRNAVTELDKTEEASDGVMRDFFKRINDFDEDTALMEVARAKIRILKPFLSKCRQDFSQHTSLWFPPHYTAELVSRSHPDYIGRWYQVYLQMQQNWQKDANRCFQETKEVRQMTQNEAFASLLAEFALPRSKVPHRAVEPVLAPLETALRESTGRIQFYTEFSDVPGKLKKYRDYSAIPAPPTPPNSHSENPGGWLPYGRD